MPYENLLVEMAEGVATVTIQRPKVLNALNRALLLELEQAFAALEKDPGARVIVLTGAGEKAFVAGADIAEMEKLSPVEARDFALLGQRVFAAIEAFPKPVIAAVNGYALGGGCELALCCDLRLAAESARFGQPEINLGILPGFAGSQRLPRLIGKGRAKEMLFTGEMIDAREAWRIGLANHVVVDGGLREETLRLAKKMAGKGLVALRLCKEAVNHGMEMESSRAAAFEADLFGLAFSTGDQREGMRAFLEKRPARFADH